MCFFTKKLRRKTAKYDIPCFIITLCKEDSDLVSFTGFHYKLGENYSSKITVVNGNLQNFFLHLQSLKGGFTSYNPERVKIKKQKSDSIHFEASLVEKHSLIVQNKKMHYALVSCVIPFGATYYENEMGEFISDEITTLNYKLI